VAGIRPYFAFLPVDSISGLAAGLCQGALMDMDAMFDSMI